MRDDDFFTCMGERGTLSIVLALRDAGRPLIFKDLLPIIGNNQTLRFRLDSMEEEGLIDMVVVLTGHKMISISLTDAGREVAALLSLANRLVSPDKKTREKSIDSKYADPILRLLRGRDYLVQKEIIAAIPSYASVVKAADALEKDGLLIHTVKTEWPKEDRYSLTPLGDQIAEIYQTIWETIDSVRIKG